MTSERLASRATTSIAADGGHVERLEDGLDRGQRRAAGERRQRPQPALVVGEQQLVAPADRRPSARRRSGLRLVGSLSTPKRSSSRRAISAIDSVLVRAAASSIASGRPSSDRHSSCSSRVVAAPCGAAA